MLKIVHNAISILHIRRFDRRNWIVLSCIAELGIFGVYKSMGLMLFLLIS